MLLYLFIYNPEDSLTCAVYIRRRKSGASLVEISEGMSELQVYTQNENNLKTVCASPS